MFSAETKPPGWPIVTVPIGQPGAPQVGSQPGSPGEANRGKGNTTAFSASVEIFGSVVAIDRSGAAPGGGRSSSSRKRRRLDGKLRQATRETDRGVR